MTTYIGASVYQYRAWDHSDRSNRARGVSCLFKSILSVQIWLSILISFLPLTPFNPFGAGAGADIRRHKLTIDMNLIYRRQILTSTVDPRTETINYDGHRPINNTGIQMKRKELTKTFMRISTERFVPPPPLMFDLLLNNGKGPGNMNMVISFTNRWLFMEYNC